MDTDATMAALREGIARDNSSYLNMMRSCLIAIADVINHQYKKHLLWNLHETLEEETKKSARSHNTDAEEMVGMFSAAKQRSPNETLCHLSCWLRAKKNRTVEFLDNLNPEEKEIFLRKAISFGRRQK